jgi:predicted nicotinamide N-methyase
VLATDWSNEAIAMTAANAERNGVTLETLVCSWTAPAPLLERAPWDLVLASDVLYEARNADTLLALLPRLGNHVWLADPGRKPAERFLSEAAHTWTISERRVSELANGAVYRLRQPVAT